MVRQGLALRRRSLYDRLRAIAQYDYWRRPDTVLIITPSVWELRRTARFCIDNDLRDCYVAVESRDALERRDLRLWCEPTGLFGLSYYTLSAEGIRYVTHAEEIVEYVADFQEFLKEGTFPEKNALIRNFVEGIEVVGDEATLTYTVPMPSDGVTSESASVLEFVQSGPPTYTVDRTVFELWLGGL